MARRTFGARGMRSIFVASLAAIPVVVAGCGGGSSHLSSPRTSQGLKHDYLQVAHLINTKHGDQVCANYVSAQAQKAIKAVGEDCQSMMAQGGANTSTRGWSAKIRGNDATFSTTTAKGSAVYNGDHWLFNATK